MPLLQVKGKVSWFGGPEDTGVSPSEGLAFFYDYDDAPFLFLDEQPYGTTGLARRLDPDVYYVACRWDYNVTPKDMLRDTSLMARVRAKGKEFLATPADWGPHVDTDRVADISKGLMEALGITTDDEIEVIYPAEEMAMKVVISSGHGKYVRGAAGYLDEVDEARKVVERVAEIWREQGVGVETFHDDTSHSQSENLNTIVAYHNNKSRDLDVSVHFNAFEQTDTPMGSEVLYVTQSSLAAKVSTAIAGAIHLPNRGAKKRTDLFFLNETEEPSILLEVCFVDSSKDSENYNAHFEHVCQAIATSISGQAAPPVQPGEPPPVDTAEKVVDVQIYAPPGVRVDVSINQDTEG